MSKENDDAAVEKSSCCANCGIAEIDDINLKNCTACYLVRYCSVECQKDHRKKHKRVCKKRAAELRDELLFRQPEGSYLGDCPICCLPLPLQKSRITMMTCCSKVICNGCNYANRLREEEMRLEQKCPFCRKTRPEMEEENEKQNMERVNANDPIALLEEGFAHFEGGNYIKAIEYWKKSAELGEADAHMKLAVIYHEGKGIDKDEEKALYHMEEAAIGGHPNARLLLGTKESEKGNNERAMKHCIIGASQGCDFSMRALMDAFKKGVVEKDVLASTLRAHQAAVDATKSPQREKAEEYRRKL